MRVLGWCALALGLAGCTTSYWDRPGAGLADLARESEGCYQAALAVEAPAAMVADRSNPRLLPRLEPPPVLWKRSPREAGFERFDEQLRYERCMRALGWQPTQASRRPL